MDDSRHGNTRPAIKVLFRLNTNKSLGNMGGRNVQLSFYVLENLVKDELNEFKSEYDEFHILTYKIDRAFQISKIIHYLPNPADNIAYEIEDLSEHISSAELTNEEREVIAPGSDDELITPAAFDLGIFDEEERK